MKSLVEVSWGSPHGLMLISFQNFQIYLSLLRVRSQIGSVFNLLIARFLYRSSSFSRLLFLLLKLFRARLRFLTLLLLTKILSSSVLLLYLLALLRLSRLDGSLTLCISWLCTFSFALGWLVLSWRGRRLGWGLTSMGWASLRPGSWFQPLTYFMSHWNLVLRRVFLRRYLWLWRGMNCSGMFSDLALCIQLSNGHYHSQNLVLPQTLCVELRLGLLPHPFVPQYRLVERHRRLVRGEVVVVGVVRPLDVLDSTVLASKSAPLVQQMLQVEVQMWGSRLAGGTPRRLRLPVGTVLVLLGPGGTLGRLSVLLVYSLHSIGAHLETPV